MHCTHARRRFLHSGVALMAMAGVCAHAEPPSDVPEPKPMHSPVLVGCYYFPGHFNAMRWAPMARFGHPYPLLGYYRDGHPKVSDWHIKWALEHGIDFFAFDWYYNHKTGHVSDHNKALDQGFLRAKYRDLMKFCIFWCNEERDWSPYTQKQMLTLAQTLKERYLHRSNYLRLAGKAPVFISVPGRMIESFGVDGSRRMWQTMGREAGVELLPIAKQHTDQATLAKAGYGAITAYNYAGVNLPKGQSRAPYDSMVSGYEDIWKQATAEGKLPYIVPVSPGWDSRPWHGEEAMVRTEPRPAKFLQMCEAAKRYVDSSLNAVIIECWNEFGEGSYIEPCTQYGFGYLDAVRDAFCPDNPHHLDLTPRQLGLSVPVYEEVPLLGPEDVISQDGNLLYNPGFETNWGWVYYSGSDAAIDASRAHGGGRAAVVSPAEGGLKTVWTVQVKPGETVELWAWVLCEEGAGATVQSALYSGPNRWLGSYEPIGSSDGTQWTRVDRTVTWASEQATHLNIEVVPRGGRVWVDDVGIRKTGP